jgi:hypothetical protein
MNSHRHSPYPRTSPRSRASISPVYNNYPSPVVRTITPGSLSDRSTPETTASNDLLHLFDTSIPASHLSFGLDTDLNGLGLEFPLDSLLFNQVLESDESRTESPLPLQVSEHSNDHGLLFDQSSPVAMALTADMLQSLRAYSASAPPQQQRPSARNKLESVASDDDHNQQSELRRQVHIQSEQRRRAQIKDGFEDLRMLVPQCSGNRKVSKAVILSHAVTYIEQLRDSQEALKQDVQRLQRDNEQIRTLLESLAMRQQFGQMSGKW